MIRAAFLITFSDRLLGQLNYFRNLLEALHGFKGSKIEPVIFTGKNTESRFLDDFPPIEVVKTGLLDRKTHLWLIHKALQSSFSKDIMLENLLIKNKISVLSHAGPLGKNSRVKTLGWIPDFQHKHLPELFNKSQLIYRDKIHRRLCRECTCLLLSSYDALNDLKEFHPNCINKARVLQFVAGPLNNIDSPSLATLEKKYNFTGPYFHLPNQFWVHKNHRVVIEALKILKDAGLKVQVVLTGKTFDDRQPDHYKDLLLQVESSGLSNAFHVLGVVPYSDLIALMKNAAALINPSLFEGWSSTVEEAKSLGKRIILSDIPIHREQNPPGGLYFNPHDPKMLADHMQEILVCHNKVEETTLAKEAKKKLFERKSLFAKEYQDIVMSITCHNQYN